MTLEKKLKETFIEWHREHPDDPYLHRLHSQLLKQLGEVADKIRERMNSRDVEKEAILKAVDEDQQLPMASQEVALRSSYWISGYNQAMKEVLGLLVEDSKEKITAKEK